MFKKNVLVPIAHGVEEIETVTIIGVLRHCDLPLRVSNIQEREVR